MTDDQDDLHREDDVDRYDDDFDDYDDFDDDDFGDGRNEKPVRARSSRDTWLLAGAAVAIIAIVVLVIAFKGDNKKSTTAGGATGGTDTSQSSSSSDSTQKQAPQWPDQAAHPPKGLEGSGKPTPGAAALAPGVYFWYSFNWQVVVVPGPGVGPLTVGVRDTNATTDPAKQVDVKVLGTAPPGVVAANPARNSLTLSITPQVANTVIGIDVNGFIGSLTWTFDGVDPKMVHLGTSPDPIAASPVVITKQQFNK